MADSTITALPLASGIDPAADWFAIDRTSLNTTQKINRNVMLGISGSPVGTTDGQGLSNKVLDNTNVLTLKDNLLTLQDGGDITRQAQFQLSSITPGSTRIYTLPDATSTIANLTSAQTLTNKTLTSPVISGGTIDNSTITVDAISGHTTANSGTIYGVAVTSAKISGSSLTNASVTSTQLADSSVTPAKLLASTGTTWAWQSYVPVWTSTGTGPSIGNGTIVGKFIQTGKTIFYRINVVFGSTSTFGTGSYRFSLPDTANFSPTGLSEGIGWWGGVHTNNYGGVSELASTTTVGGLVFSISTAGQFGAEVAPTTPVTWVNGDSLWFQGFYEAA